MNVKIKSVTDALLYTAVMPDDTPETDRLRLAVEAAVAAGARLARAYLANANLAGAYLANAYL